MKINILDTVNIEISIEELKDIFVSLRDLVVNYFSRKNDPRILSLKEDILSAFDELLDNLHKYTDFTSDEQWRIILWLSTENDWKMTTDFFRQLVNNRSNPLFVWFENYMKTWYYKDILSALLLKIKAYWNTLKKCFDDYWIKSHAKSLKREKKILVWFINDNYISLKKAYVDFMAKTFYPQLTDEQRDYAVNQLYKRDYFKEYVPIMKTFFDKIEKRINFK